MKAFLRFWISLSFSYDQDDLFLAFSCSQSLQNKQSKIDIYEVFHRCEHFYDLQCVVLKQNLYHKYHICTLIFHWVYELIPYAVLCYLLFFHILSMGPFRALFLCAGSNFFYNLILFHIEDKFVFLENEHLLSVFSNGRNVPAPTLFTCFCSDKKMWICSDSKRSFC